MQDLEQPEMLLPPGDRTIYEVAESGEVAPRPIRRILLLTIAAAAFLAVIVAAPTFAGRSAPVAVRLRRRASLATAPVRSQQEVQYRWMWGDAGNNSFGHDAAELDPFRWSSWMGPNAAVTDIHNYNRGRNVGRPIEMEVGGLTGAALKKFPHADQAIHYILQREHSAASQKTETTQYWTHFKWMWADAGNNTFGHDVAEMDPFRWSLWMKPDGMIKDLEAFRTQANVSRAVEVVAQSPGAPTLRFDSIDEAVRFLGHYQAHHAQDPSATSAHVDQATTAPNRPGSIPSHDHLEMSGSHSLGGDKGESPQLHLLLGVTAFLVMTALAGVCFCSARRHSKKGAADLDDDEGFCGAGFLKDEDSQANTAQALRGAFAEGEFRSLLAGDDGTPREATAKRSDGDEDALNPPPTPAQTQEAEQEVERILGQKDPSAIFGAGTAAQQKAEYRRLIRLLHPDKGLVTGQRAALALRRVVEANTAFNEAASATE